MDAKIFFCDMVTNPIESHVRGFLMVLFYGVVYNTARCGVGGGDGSSFFYFLVIPVLCV